MAEALAKIKDNAVYPASTGDTDGLLLTNLLEALTGGNRLNVGQKGRVTHSAVNYTAATQIVDDHLSGIDTALGGKASTSHKSTHVSGGGDAFASSDLLEAIVKRLQVTGPTTLTLGTVADGKYLKRSGSTLVGDDPPGMSAHAIGGSYHTEDSLANLNSKITGGNLDFNTATRTPTLHNLGSNLRHGVDTLSNVNALISGGNLDFDTASRPPSGSAGGDLSGSYPSPTVAKIQGYTVQSGAPATDAKLVYQNSQWERVSTSKVRAYLSSSLEVPTSTATLVEFDAETYDTLGDFNTGTHRFVAPVTGYYLVNASLEFDALAASNLRIFLYRNAVLVTDVFWVASSSTDFTMLLHDVVYMTASQYLEVKVYQNSGDTYLLLSGEARTHLEVARLL